MHDMGQCCCRGRGIHAALNVCMCVRVCACLCTCVCTCVCTCQCDCSNFAGIREHTTPSLPVVLCIMILHGSSDSKYWSGEEEDAGEVGVGSGLGKRRGKEHVRMMMSIYGRLHEAKWCCYIIVLCMNLY